MNRRVGGPVAGLAVLFVMWWAEKLPLFTTTMLGFVFAAVGVFVEPWIRDQFRRRAVNTADDVDDRDEPAPPPRPVTRLPPVATQRRDVPYRATRPANTTRPGNAARRHDAWVLGGFAVLGVTVLVPWLVGRFLLRDSVVLEQNPNVFDTSVRDGGSYFFSDYLSGLLVPGVLAVAFLLLRPWARRTGFVAAAFFLAGLMLVTTSLDTGAPRYLMGLSMRHPESPWRLDLTSVGIAPDTSYQPEAVQLGSVVAVDDQLDYYRHRLLGVDIRTGQVLWTLQCPNDYSSSDFVRIDTDPADTMRMRCGRGGIGSLDEYLFGDAATLTPVS